MHFVPGRDHDDQTRGSDVRFDGCPLVCYLHVFPLGWIWSRSSRTLAVTMARTVSRPDPVSPYFPGSWPDPRGSLRALGAPAILEAAPLTRSGLAWRDRRQYVRLQQSRCGVSGEGPRPKASTGGIPKAYFMDPFLHHPLPVSVQKSL